MLGVYSLVLPHTPPSSKPGDAIPFVKALGLFEDPFVDSARADEISGSVASRSLALDAARQAIGMASRRRGWRKRRYNCS